MAGRVHEVAQEIDLAARTLNVDVDPVAVAHGRAMVEDHTCATLELRGSEQKRFDLEARLMVN